MPQSLSSKIELILPDGQQKKRFSEYHKNIKRSSNKKNAEIRALLESIIEKYQYVLDRSSHEINPDDLSFKEEYNGYIEKINESDDSGDFISIPNLITDERYTERSKLIQIAYIKYVLYEYRTKVLFHDVVEEKQKYRNEFISLVSKIVPEFASQTHSVIYLSGDEDKFHSAGLDLMHNINNLWSFQVYDHHIYLLNQYIITKFRDFVHVFNSIPLNNVPPLFKMYRKLLYQTLDPRIHFYRLNSNLFGESKKESLFQVIDGYIQYISDPDNIKNNFESQQIYINLEYPPQEEEE